MLSLSRCIVWLGSSQRQTHTHSEFPQRVFFGVKRGFVPREGGTIRIVAVVQPSCNRLSSSLHRMISSSNPNAHIPLTLIVTSHINTSHLFRFRQIFNTFVFSFVFSTTVGESQRTASMATASHFRDGLGAEAMLRPLFQTRSSHLPTSSELEGTSPCDVDVLDTRQLHTYLRSGCE